MPLTSLLRVIIPVVTADSPALIINWVTRKKASKIRALIACMSSDTTWLLVKLNKATVKVNESEYAYSQYYRIHM